MYSVEKKYSEQIRILFGVWYKPLMSPFIGQAITQEKYDTEEITKSRKSGEG
jgi:hypothetical protein